MKSDVLQKVGIITGIGLSVGVSAALIRCLVNKKTSVPAISDRNNPVELKIEVPRKSLGYIIGRKGATISRIREQTDTSIKVSDQSDEIAVIIVRGQKRKAEGAIDEITRIITSLPHIVTKEVLLNENTWPLIVGIDGNNVRNLSSESKTELAVKWIKASNGSDYKPCKYIITIKGSGEQINHAMALIDERVAQANIQQQNKIVGVAGRPLFYNIAPSMHNSSVSQEVLPTDTADGYVSVFVSAVQSPSHFWLQNCGPKSSQLDKLVNEMSEFYREEIEHNSSSYRLQSVVPSEMVAVYNDGDKDYYRALVLSVEKNQDMFNASILFVDFGDSRICGLNDMFKLKPEYLSMPFQGIKCSLHNILPVDGDRWSMEAIELFEEITHVANWVTLMAKPISTTSVNENEEATNLVQVSLIDTNGPTDIDISQRLVDAGFAVYLNQQ